MSKYTNFPTQIHPTTEIQISVLRKLHTLSLNMCRINVKEQLLCINVNYLQATPCSHTGRQNWLIVEVGKERRKEITKEKYLHLTKHMHYFMKSLSNGSCAKLTMFHRVYKILEMMYFTQQICAVNFILTW